MPPSIAINSDILSNLKVSPNIIPYLAGFEITVTDQALFEISVPFDPLLYLHPNSENPQYKPRR